MKKHSKLSPSSSKQWITCPGSIGLISKLIGKIESKSSFYADEGNIAHDLGELCLNNGHNADKFLGEEFTYNETTVKVDQDMIDAVNVYYEYCMSQHDSYIFENGSCNMLVEKFFSSKSYGIPGLDGGTSDCTFISGGTLHNVDYKHGKGVAVEIENNSQLMIYAICALISEYCNIDDIYDITMTIVQPRAFHKDGSIRSVTISKDKLLNWAEFVMLPAARLTQEFDAPLRATEEGCRWCPVKESDQGCPELDRVMKLSLELDFGSKEVDETEDMNRDIWILDKIPLITSYGKSINSKIKTKLEKGETCYSERFKIVESKTNRKLKPEITPFVSVLDDYLDESELYNTKHKGIGEIEKSLKRNIKDVDKLKDIINDVFIKPKGEPTVVKIEDPRKPIEKTITDEFDKIEEDL